MQTLTPVPTRGQIRNLVPVTEPKYGVVFGRGGTFDYDAEMLAIRNRKPKTLVVAILQVLQFEDYFRHLGVSGHLIDLETGLEVEFSRQAPYDIAKPINFWTRYEPSLN